MYSERNTHVDELYDIESPLSPFIFRDERLGTAKRRRNLGLRQTSPLPGCNQEQA